MSESQASRFVILTPRSAPPFTWDHGRPRPLLFRLPRSVTQLTIHFIQQRLVRQITPEVFGEDLENIIIITR